MFARLRLSAPLARFFRHDQGTVTVFALGMFVCIVMIGGFAIDLMRYEASRTRLQNTLDRAALAAASLNQSMDAQQVVNEYVGKEGLLGDVTRTDIATSVNARSVGLEASSDTNPLFMHMLGIDQFDAVAGARAEQAATKLELSLVLDVSGSMYGAKVANLKIAAKEFIDTVLAADTEGRISISIVPYNGIVNLGDDLFAELNIAERNGVAGANCVDLPDDAFDRVGIDANVALHQTTYADPYPYQSSLQTAPDWSVYYEPTLWENQTHDYSTSCPPGSTNTIMLPSTDRAALKAHIDALQAWGTTSINQGMKWGTTLLDPGTRPIMDRLAASNAVASDLRGMPVAYGSPDVMKVVILMTDGENVGSTVLNPAYRSGPSPVSLSTGDGNYSIYHATAPGTDQYWVPHLGIWQGHAWDSGAGVQALSWTELWKKQTVSWVAWQLYARALSPSPMDLYDGFYGAIETITTSNIGYQMDMQLQSVCTQAKANDVIVYGIAFEAPLNGRQQISDCASSPAHFFDASGLQIQSAFRTIASNLTQLKLTQ